MAQWLKDPFIISLIILAAVGGGLAWVKLRPTTKPPDPYLGSQTSEINKIEITEPGRTTMLIKENDQWLVKTEKEENADQQLVLDLLNKLKILAPAEKVSQNPDNHDKYDLTPEKAVRLSVFKNNLKLLDLLIGKVGPGFNNHYFRKHDKDEVYLSNTPLKSVLFPPAGWVNSESVPNNNSLQ